MRVSGCRWQCKEQVRLTSSGLSAQQGPNELALQASYSHPAAASDGLYCSGPLCRASSSGLSAYLARLAAILAACTSRQPRLASSRAITPQLPHAQGVHASCSEGKGVPKVHTCVGPQTRPRYDSPLSPSGREGNILGKNSLRFLGQLGRA